jgi:hypothetical protein
MSPSIAPTTRRPDGAATTETERFLTYAHSLSLKKLAQLSRASNGTLAALYATCLEQRLQLAWGRYANWLIQAKNIDERAAIRMANTQFGATPLARVENALSGRLDDTVSQAEEQQVARTREAALVAEAEVDARGGD